MKFNITIKRYKGDWMWTAYKSGTPIGSRRTATIIGAKLMARRRCRQYYQEQQAKKDFFSETYNYPKEKGEYPFPV